MREPGVVRDERTLAIENGSYRFAYLVMTYGLLVAIAYRAFALGQSSWDLLSLVLAGGLVTTLYQAFHRVLSRHWLAVTLVAMLVAAAVAAAAVYFGQAG
jgi:hypothetical protein